MKFMYKYLVLSALVLTAFGCEENEYEDIVPTTAVSFELETYTLDLESNDDTFELELQSTTVSTTDRVFSIEVLDESADGSVATTADPDTYSFTSQITIPAGELTGSTDMTFLIDDLDFVDPQVVVFNLVDGDFVKNVTREEFVLEYQKACPLTLATLELTFDAYAEEAYWEIYDLSGTPMVILSGGEGSAYGDLDDTTLSLQFCLDSGSYGLVVYDNYGDGGTGYVVSVDGVSLASGSTPDAGGGYPVTTQSTATFNID